MSQDTETTLWIIDLQVPGIEEKTQQVRAFRQEMENTSKSTTAAKEPLNAFGETAAQAEKRLASLGSSVSQSEDSIKGLAKTTSQTASEVTQAVEAMAAAGKKIGYDWAPAMDQSRKATYDWAAAFLGAQAPVKQLEQELRALQAQLVGLRTAQAEAGAGGSKLFADQIKGVQLEIQQVSTQLRTARTAETEFTQGIRGSQQVVGLFATQVSQLAGGIPGLAQGMQGATGAAMGLGGGSTAAGLALVGLTVAGVAAAGTVTHLGAEWQTTVDMIANGANVTREEASAMMESFRGLETVVAKDALTIGNAYAEVAGRLGTYHGAALSVAEADEIMRVAGEGALASNEKLDVATRALAEGMTSSQASIADADRVMNALYITSRNTGLGLDQTANLAGRLQERMGAAAPPIEGVGEALTLAAQAGAQGQRGMQPVITLMEHMSTLTPKARDDLAGLGVQVQKNAQGQLDFAGTFENLKTAYDSLATAEEKHALLVNLVGEQTGVLEAMLKATPGQIHAVVSAYDNHNRVADDAAKRQAELAVQMDKVTSAAKNEAAALGQQLAGAIVSVANAGARFGQTIDQMPEPAKRLLGLTASSGVPVASQLAGLAAQMGQDTANRERGSLTGGAPVHDTYAQEQAAAPSGGERQPLDVGLIRDQANALSSMTGEGQRIAKVMDEYWKSTGLPSDQIKAVKDITEATNQQAIALERVYDPTRPQLAAQMVARLRQLTDEYTAALQNNDAEQTKAAQAALTGFQQQVVQEEAASRRNTVVFDAGKRQREEQHTEEKRVADEARRRAIEDRDFARQYGAPGEGVGGLARQHLDEQEELRGRQLGAQQELTAATREHEAAIRGTKEGYEDADTALKREEQDTDVLTKMAREDADEGKRETRELGDEKTRVDRETADYARSLSREVSDDHQRFAREDADYEKSLTREKSDYALSEGRRVSDTQRGYSRSDRDANIQSARELETMQREHTLRLAEIQKTGGARVGEETTRENEAYQQRQQDFQRQQGFARQDRDLQRTDRQQDMQLDASRHQEDVGRSMQRHVVDTGLSRQRHNEDRGLAHQRHDEDVALTRDRWTIDHNLAIGRHTEDLGMTRERAAVDLGLARDRQDAETGLRRERQTADTTEAQWWQDQMTQGAGGIRDAIDHLYGVAPEQIAEANSERQKAEAFATRLVQRSDEYATNMERAAEAAYKAGENRESDVQKYIKAGGTREEFEQRNPNIPHFADGGAFVVPGSGGTDSQKVSFMASPGEVVGVYPAAARTDFYGGTRNGPGIAANIPGIHDYYAGTQYHQDYAPQPLAPSMRFGGDQYQVMATPDAPKTAAGGSTAAGQGQTVEIHNHFDLGGAVLASQGAWNEFMDHVNESMTKSFRSKVMIGSPSRA